MSQFSIRVPATTANLGPGFDVLGLALNLYLNVDVIYGSNKSIVITHTGQGEGKVALDETNLLLSSAIFLAKKINKTLPSNLNMQVYNEIPIGAGLGSSGAAIVAGVLLANQVLNLQLSRDQLLTVCVEIEGHPDNVTPALVGGCVVCCGKEKPEAIGGFVSNVVYLPVPFDTSIQCVAVTPHFHLSTAKSRVALPEKYTKKDVIFNLQRVGLLVAGLGDKKNKEVLREALKDVVHQPYRAKLVPGLEKILSLNTDTELHKKGLIGITLSGSGPSIMCLTDGNSEYSRLIGERIRDCFKESDLDCTIRILIPDTLGSTITLLSKPKL
eukprot:TRINITY_DN25186_c0_g1_i1.p1 TRINITY_DN25186_c0_g1~~TRINITY_DN25186_c0_g1_i1.p1  ORF type:complete len:327 (-),score=74.41 TRINITY_DN25186_c0_g1_i1:29-1009(-)